MGICFVSPYYREDLSDILSEDVSRLETSNPVTPEVWYGEQVLDSDITGYETWDSGFGSASAEVAEWTKYSKPLIGEGF